MSFLGVMTPAAEPTAGTAFVLRIDGAIGPATAAYVEHGLKTAEGKGAAAIVLSIDTPGGLDTAMREIIQNILASPLPVLCYVSPSGARAASAGTYILYACHVAAMAPGTNLGAATPVEIGGGGLIPGIGGDEKPADGGENKDKSKDVAGDPMKAKIRNDAVAYIRSLAELRGRNADWAEKAVREAASLPASAALKENVIDMVVPNLDRLLSDADGRMVTINGVPVKLATAGLVPQQLEPDWRTEFLAAITNPNVALILMMLGVYGLFFEFINPGAVYPGTVGGICLLVGLYALGMLPVNYAGLGLILLGLVLMVAEAFAPSFGILGISGTTAFVLGAMVLFDTGAPGFQISWAIIAAVAGTSLLLALIVVPMAISSFRRRVVTGREEMIGSVGEVQDWVGSGGHVFIHSERWRAVSDAPLAPKQKVRVTAIDGLTLTVEPVPASQAKENQDV